MFFCNNNYYVFLADMIVSLKLIYHVVCGQRYAQLDVVRLLL